jgi:hypothetical protein
MKQSILDTLDGGAVRELRLWISTRVDTIDAVYGVNHGEQWNEQRDNLRQTARTLGFTEEQIDALLG